MPDPEIYEADPDPTPRVVGEHQDDMEEVNDVEDD